MRALVLLAALLAVATTPLTAATHPARGVVTAVWDPVTHANVGQWHWYNLTLRAKANVTFTLTWSGPTAFEDADLHVYPSRAFDNTGVTFDVPRLACACARTGTPERETVTLALAPGFYPVMVVGIQAQATPYELVASAGDLRYEGYGAHVGGA